ncbi:hypothetical protein HIM_03857 [Hirsutella minnesotensis 3608]|uniref:Uncharacterized protein n=1 Tax=Hirsutella minnesotensis 3608 TaxID=1043627 RepID=A0A0F7ZQB9_9HYPO|nr:hypothetical protein HIM_03857 [Hirsutella minnesotensis 3608]
MPCTAQAPCGRFLMLASCAVRQLKPSARPLMPLARASLLRHVERRSYAQLSKQVGAKENQQKERANDGKKQAEHLGRDQTHNQIPERLIIYHAGTGRITFLAMLKLTSIFVSVFFCANAASSYIKADKPAYEVVAVSLCGVVPFALIAYTSAPFVTQIHIHLPSAARASRLALERYVQAIPPSAPLSFTNISGISLPRYSKLQAGDLRPAPPRARRFGLVNFVRDTTAENAARKWYNLRAVGKFYVQEAPIEKHHNRSKTAKVGRKGVVDVWIWDAIKGKIASRAAAKETGRP